MIHLHNSLQNRIREGSDVFFGKSKSQSELLCHFLWTKRLIPTFHHVLHLDMTQIDNITQRHSTIASLSFLVSLIAREVFAAYNRRNWVTQRWIVSTTTANQAGIFWRKDLLHYNRFSWLSSVAWYLRDQASAGPLAPGHLVHVGPVDCRGPSARIHVAHSLLDV